MSILGCGAGSGVARCRRRMGLAQSLARAAKFRSVETGRDETTGQQDAGTCRPRARMMARSTRPHSSLALDWRTMIVLALILLALMGWMYFSAVRPGAMGGGRGVRAVVFASSNRGGQRTHRLAPRLRGERETAIRADLRHVASEWSAPTAIMRIMGARWARSRAPRAHCAGVPPTSRASSATSGTPR